MKEEQNRVEKTKRKKRTKTAILIILFLLVISGGTFALVNGKNLFSDHTAKSKHVSISSETKESKSKSSTSSSYVSNSDERKTELDTTDLSNEQVVEWINYVVDNWKKTHNIAWPYTVDRLNDLNGRDSNSIYYSVIFQNPKYPMMILRINSEGIMEFETNTVDATKNKNFEYKVLSKNYKDISLINDLDASELSKISQQTEQSSNNSSGYSSLNINQRISLMARLHDKIDFQDFVNITYNITELPDGTQNVVIRNYGLHAHTETIAYKVDKTTINPSSFPSDQITTKNDLFKIYEQDKDKYNELATKVSYDSSLEFSQNN
ncbi:hypothetical protein HRG64_14120 [Enterococcus faecalis]|nr:hypothetical protein [Enterococcus faecalis]